MRDLTRKFFNPTSGDAIEREVEEELRFHVESLTEQYLEDADSFEEARAAALRRFGDVDEVKDECVEITKRQRPFTRALKSFLILMFLGGVFVRIFGTDVQVLRVGDMLMAIAAMARLFLYVRDLKPAVFRPKSTSSPLKLNSSGRKPTSLFDN